MANFAYNPRTKKVTIWKKEVDGSCIVLVLDKLQARRLYKFLGGLWGGITNAEKTNRHS